MYVMVKPENKHSLLLENVRPKSIVPCPALSDGVSAWSLPSQPLNGTAITSSAKRQLIKDFVAKVQELIRALVKQLTDLTATKKIFRNENVL
ncbi:uncharacterized protein LOC108091295 [Drosophila ficusphila]|uniref:uncharacterized protein LOC108091295 n=1 Tax=Drosophila ficusphila TaxID=30025 RepID=UPI001C8A1BAE|nr:uncharacterized protein LOC108091295 [Drosophila ficusphila]